LQKQTMVLIELLLRNLTDDQRIDFPQGGSSTKNSSRLSKAQSSLQLTAHSKMLEGLEA
jgi:hypothetical protein